jgi:flagellar export protein FliJ
MTTFKFRLEKVLQLKTSQARTEEFKLEALLRQRAQMQAEMDAADSSLLQARKSIESATFSTSAELLAFEHYKIRAEKERQEALRKLAAHDETVEKQRSAVLAARRGVLLLEKLREKRRADWQTEADKELEALAADFSAAQWLRSERESNRN